MEQSFIKWLEQHVPGHSSLAVGLGDDAAVMKWQAREDCVVTTDLVADGVHFQTSEHTPPRIGHKALAVNLSDLAAMAARPVAAFVSILLPTSWSQSRAEQIYAGILPLAEALSVAIAGGDTNRWSGPLVISVTAIGQVVDQPLTRSGASAGDEIVVSGSLGGSLLGHHLDFIPRVREMLQLRADFELRGGLDISDGLALDAARLAAASGCGVELDLDAIPISEAAQEMSREDARSPLEHALGDGEDFEMLLALAPQEASRLLCQQPLDVPVTRVGRCIAARGLWQRGANGIRTPLEPKGFEH